MNKLIINNRTDMSMLEALKYVTKFIKKGPTGVSGDVDQYYYIINRDDEKQEVNNG